MKRKVTDSYKSRKKRQRTWSEFGKQAAAGASAATLGFIVGNVPTAMEAGMAAYEYVAPDLEVQDIADGGGEGGFPQKSTMASYVGKFSSSGKTSVVDKDKKIYQKKGYVKTIEQYGSVTDPDVVYITHSTYSASLFAEVMAQAMVRKLLTKAKWDISQWFNQAIPLSWNSTVTTGAQTGWMMQLGNTSIAGTEFKQTYVFANGINLDDIARQNFVGVTWSLTTFFLKNIQGDPAYSNPRFLKLYMETGQATNPYSLVASVNLQEEYVYLCSHSILTLQNRTAPASYIAKDAADKSMGYIPGDAVDAQPLAGKKYEFKGGVPRANGDYLAGNVKLERLDKSGIELIPGSILSAGYSKPPVSSVFANVRKSNNISLNPGAIKSAHIVSYFKGRLIDLLGRLSGKFDTAITAPNGLQTSYSPGHCEMIALEEKMNTGSSNKVLVGYQMTKSIGCYSVTKSTPTILEQRVDEGVFIV